MTVLFFAIVKASMKRTVLIIARNEATHIAECLESIGRQTVIPDELLLIAHNCTDNTVNITKNFPNVRIEELLTEEQWPIFARIRWFELATHEIVACIDGDSVAADDWLEIVTKPFKDEKVVWVGGHVSFRKSILANIMAMDFFLLWKYRRDFHFYFWGANFACRKSVYHLCGWLTLLIRLKKELSSNEYPDDCYLSLALEKFGRVVYEWRAKVATYPKNMNLFSWLSRGKRQDEDRKRLFRFFGV